MSVRAGRGGLQREIAVPRIQKPGLALAGYTEQLHEHRLLVLGGTEIDYLRTIGADELAVGVSAVMASHPACLIITRGLQPPDALTQACEADGVPLLVSQLASADLIANVTHYLAEKLAPRTTVHGVMLDVWGIGILILGKSGIGKSETALDLVSRGHRLVSDDVVELLRPSPRLVYAAGTGIVRYHMEIRGLGIINIKDLFGIAAIRDTKKVELVVELVKWNESEEYDRLGIDGTRYEVLEVAIPKLRLPVRPGRAVANIIEVAARNQLLKLQGHHSAHEFRDRLDRAIAAATPHRYDTDLVE